jgi:hypothetical protein
MFSPWAIAQRNQRTSMAERQIHDMLVIAHTGTFRSLVVIAEKRQHWRQAQYAKLPPILAIGTSR